MQTGYPARPRTSLPSLPLFLYVEGPSLPARPFSVIVLGIGFYLDRVSARGKAPGGARQAAAGPPIIKPHRLPVEVHVYVVPGQEAAIHGLHECLDVGSGTLDNPGGARPGYEDSTPRTTAVRAPRAARSPPSSSSAHALSTPSQRCHDVNVALENKEPGVGCISSKHRRCASETRLFYECPRCQGLEPRSRRPDNESKESATPPSRP